jgi:hypothetical protein
MLPINKGQRRQLMSEKFNPESDTTMTLAVSIENETWTDENWPLLLRPSRVHSNKIPSCCSDIAGTSLVFILGNNEQLQ